MQRFMNRVVDVWDWFRRLLGFDRVSKSKRQEDLAGRSRLSRILYFARPALAGLVLLYVALLVSRFSIIHGDELSYPQRVIVAPDPVATPGQPQPGQTGVCRDSQTVRAVAYVLDVLVNQNTWVPMDPQFKIGYLGLAGFEPGPFFDNKASFQLGALSAVQRMSIELADMLGRARRTSAPDTDLIDARGAVQWNPRAWIINPFDPRVPFLSTSAASAYRNAIRDYEAFNQRLAICEGLFDARSDNLFVLLERLANDIAGLSEELSIRTKGVVWDVGTKAFVPGAGNNLGFFDMRADNLFWRAHGMMWAYHGILQGLRYDFADAIAQNNGGPIWDRMEGHVAEAAAMRPLIVSNGRSDSLFQPDHLSLLAVNMLRAQANMIELREVINR
jgi:hypothetical protein